MANQIKFKDIEGLGNVVNVEDFGAVHDGSTDDTTAIQNAINAVFALGGGVVYFPVGVYIIASTAGNGAQILMPNQAYSTGGNQTTLTRIKLLGEMGPNMFSDPLAGGAPPTTGVILKSTVLSAASILGSSTAFASFLHTDIENITFRVRSKTAGVDVAPQGNGLGFRNAAYLSLYTVAIDTESNRSATVQPATTVTGIIFPATGNYGFVNADRVLVTGYGTGFEVWECASISNYIIDGCFYGVSFNATNHAAFLSKGFISRTAIDIITRGVCFFEMDNFGFEADPAGWFKSQYNLYEAVAGAVGVIRYNRVVSNVGPDNSDFTRLSYGPSKVKVESIGYSGISKNWNDQTGQYDLVFLDQENQLTINSATDVFLRIPSDAESHIQTGAQISVTQTGAGKIAVLGFGVTIKAYQGFNVSGGIYSRLMLTKKAANSWYLNGDFGSAYSFNDGTTNAEVTAWSVASGIVDAATIAALNQFVTTLKNASIWTSFSAIYPLIGGSSAPMSYNLVNAATFQITWHGTGTFNAEGYKSNGTTGYGDTGLTPSTTLSQNSVNITFYSPDDIGQTTGCYIGAYTAAIPAGLFLEPLYTDTNNYSNINDTSTCAKITHTDGILMLARESSTVKKFVQNRTISNTTSTSTGLPTSSLTISALNRGGGTINTFATNTVGYASIGSGLNDAQKLTYFNALLVLFAALGK